MKDPIVAEVRKARLNHAKRFGFNLDAICADLRAIQAACGHRIVSLPPKKLKAPSAPTAKGRKAQAQAIV